MGQKASVRLLIAAGLTMTLDACAVMPNPGTPTSTAHSDLPAVVAADRAALAGLPASADPLRAKLALDRAFEMRAGDGGMAPPELRASRPLPVVLASVPRPVDASAVRLARAEPAPVRLASTSRPGLVKAPAAAAPQVRKASLGTAPVKAEEPAKPEVKAQAPAPAPVAAPVQPDGTVAKLTRLLRRVLGIGAPG